MPLHRRALLAAAPLLVAARAAPPPFAALADYERASGGRVGVFARNLATGRTLAWRADERFVMCSTFKASLAACVLARADRGRQDLAEEIAFGPDDLLEYAPVARAALEKAGGVRARLSVAQMCEGAVELSDNTCANLLLARIGGPAALTAFWRRTGDMISRLDHNEPVLNRSPPGDPHDTTTPAAMADNVRRFTLGEVLSPASRARLTGWMEACKTGANRLRAGLPAGWRIGDKTGNNGRDASGDLAVCWPSAGGPIVVAAYTQGGDPNERAIATVFAAIGAEVAHRLA